MSNPSIVVDNLGKMYRIGEGTQAYATMRDVIAQKFQIVCRRQAHRDAQIHWALRGASFDVQRGEVIGVIGRNGAGKSTLLKLLSRITRPSEGYAQISGRVGSLLEVGTGFHPELTGRENVYLNAAILGMCRSEVRSKFERIIEFAELERFVDTPVKRYSTGMQLRLAFAVAAHLEPEVLIVDEVLAVGDISFQKRCLGKMNETARSGRTVLLVSHDLGAVEALCNRAILLEGGRVAHVGPVRETVTNYLSRNFTTAASVDLSEHPGRRSGSSKLLRRLTFKSNHLTETCDFPAGSSCIFQLDVDAGSGLSEVELKCGVNTLAGQRIFTISSAFSARGLLSLQGCSQVLCTIPSLPLTPGTYELEIALRVRGATMDSVSSAGSFHVVSSNYFGTGKLPDARQQGMILVRSDWDTVPC